MPLSQASSPNEPFPENVTEAHFQTIEMIDALGDVGLKPEDISMMSPAAVLQKIFAKPVLYSPFAIPVEERTVWPSVLGFRNFMLILVYLADRDPALRPWATTAVEAHELRIPQLYYHYSTGLNDERYGPPTPKENRSIFPQEMLAKLSSKAIEVFKGIGAISAPVQTDPQFTLAIKSIGHKLQQTEAEMVKLFERPELLNNPYAPLFFQYMLKVHATSFAKYFTLSDLMRKNPAVIFELGLAINPAPLKTVDEEKPVLEAFFNRLKSLHLSSLKDERFLEWKKRRLIEFFKERDIELLYSLFAFPDSAEDQDILNYLEERVTAPHNENIRVMLMIFTLPHWRKSELGRHYISSLIARSAGGGSFLALDLLRMYFANSSSKELDLQSLKTLIGNGYSRAKGTDTYFHFMKYIKEKMIENPKSIWFNDFDLIQTYVQAFQGETSSFLESTFARLEGLSALSYEARESLQKESYRQERRTGKNYTQFLLEKIQMKLSILTDVSPSNAACTDMLTTSDSLPDSPRGGVVLTFRRKDK